MKNTGCFAYETANLKGEIESKKAKFRRFSGFGSQWLEKLSIFTACLNSCNTNSVVRSVARQGVYSQRMHSFIGRNAQYCASLFGIYLDNLSVVNNCQYSISGPTFSPK